MACWEKLESLRAERKDPLLVVEEFATARLR